MVLVLRQNFIGTDVKGFSAEGKALRWGDANSPVPSGPDGDGVPMRGGD